MTSPAIYRMPIVFGPYPGPRQIPDRSLRDPHGSPRRIVASVIFATRPDDVAPLLPEGFSPAQQSSIIFEVQELQQIDWLAGRGYWTMGVKIPAIFHARAGDMEGNFLAVLWENLADPVISGREELGYAKLWCDIEHTEPPGETARAYVGSWLGHTFLEIALRDLQPASDGPVPAVPMFHFKCVPRTGCPGEADAAYVTITPSANPTQVMERRLTGTGQVSWSESTWNQLPTLFHIVNTLAGIPLGKPLGASLTFSRGGKDLSDVHIIE